jgi:hypothetical protein
VGIAWVGLKASGEKVIKSRLGTIKLACATFGVLEKPDLKLIIYAKIVESRGNSRRSVLLYCCRFLLIMSVTALRAIHTT